MAHTICIIGAGLCGSLMAVRLAQRGYNVHVYEKRPDLRTVDISAGRSINLALSDRGLRALEMIGARSAAESLIIPMYGRLIHALDGDKRLYRYSGRDGEYIRSISRPGLNALLLDEAEKYTNLRLSFNTACTSVDFEKGAVSLEDRTSGDRVVETADIIIGADGAGSAVRRSMSARSGQLRFNFAQAFLDTGYKELCIPPGVDGAFRIEKNALHIWPRRGFMLIALPNLDGSFTVTLFLPFKGRHSFETLQDPTSIRAFFDAHFADATTHMPELLTDFNDNPTGSLGTIKCSPWSVAGRSLLIGDAAHAIVPFYGQGMNSAFEDCVVLDQMIDTHTGEWPRILQAYEAHRKKDADAIADLALDNFYEMRDHTADEVFNRKRRVEIRMEQGDAEYYSKYSLVTFRPDLSYHAAMVKGRAQDRIWMHLCAENPDIETWTLDRIRHAFDARASA